jgi:hypothetical protein
MIRKEIGYCDAGRCGSETLDCPLLCLEAGAVRCLGGLSDETELVPAGEEYTSGKDIIRPMWCGLDCGTRESMVFTVEIGR